VQLGEGLVAPLHHDASGPLLIAGLYAHGHEFGLIEGGLDDDYVTLLNGDTALGQEAGIILERCFFHNMVSFRVKRFKGYDSYSIAHFRQKVNFLRKFFG
jgi:hypothetical protein